MTGAPAGLRVDVVVLGGGIAGATVAAHLAADRTVALLEREPLLGRHTTGRSAAMFLPSYGAPAVHPLTRASRRFLEAPPPGFDAPLLTPRAALHIARRDQRNRLSALGRRLPRAQVLTAAGARALAPILRPDAVSGALLETDAGDIDAMALHAGLVRICREAGGLVRSGVGEIALSRTGSLWRVRMVDGEVFAPVLVNAAGAWADAAAEAAGVARLGLRPLRRTVVLAEPPPDATFAGWPIVKDVDERFYFRPFSSRLLITPCDETPSEPCDAQADELTVAVAMTRFEAVADHPVRRLTHRWAGLRTFAPDRAPVIGWSAEAEGFFWMAGLGGFGIQTAPAAGRLAAALILHRHAPAELVDQGVAAATYSPRRLVR